MTPAAGVIVDWHGRTMFFCSRCGRPMTKDDFFDLGLRVPEAGESREDYCDTELIDAVTHLRCLRSARAPW